MNEAATPAESADQEHLEGTVWQAASERELCEGLEKAFDYRGDVTITCKDGAILEGYVFDRAMGATLEESFVRLFPKNQDRKLSIAFSEIASLAFTGRDTASGKSWEAWVKKFWEKKAKGEKNIEIKPEKLD